MSEVLHANIFFFIASVATVVFCLLVSLILYQVYKITRSIRAIVERIELATELMADDIATVRALVTQGNIFSRIFNFVFGGSEKKKQARRSAE